MAGDLSRFKVIYKERVLNAVSLRFAKFRESDFPGDVGITKPKFLEIFAINSDGHLVLIRDEAWMFQFLPVVEKGGGGDG